MVFWAIIWKAIKIRRAVQKVNTVKLNAYRESIGLSRIRPWYLLPFYWVFWVLKWILLQTCFACLKKKTTDNLNRWDLLWTNGTLSNKILKSFLGIICGLIAGTVSLSFFFRQLNFQPILSIVISMMIGSFLSFGLAFSQKLRCVYFLVVPQFFTKKGRTAILGYALILSLAGPGKNAAHNMEVLSDSLICTQEMVKESMEDLVKLSKSPYATLKEIFKNLLTSLESIGKDIVGGVSSLFYFVVCIVNTIKTGIAWLKGILDLCNTETGTPYDRCWKAFDEASEDCVTKLGSWFSWMCSVVDVFQNICYLAKVVDVLCILPSLLKQYVFAPIGRKLGDIENQIKIFFYFKPIFKHELKHNLNASKTFKSIADNMKEDVLQNVRWVYDYFDKVDLVVSAFLLLVIWKSFVYLKGYLKSDRYDNRYITKGLLRMDLERRKIGKETIFPLKVRESKIYIDISSAMLLKDEWKKLRRSLYYIILASCNILLYIFIDFGLYLFLQLMGEYANIQLDTRGWLGHGAQVSGNGILAEIYRILLKGLSPVAAVMPQFDTQACLPEPNPPDYLMYSLIIFMILLALFAAVTEPYGLRFRHVICGFYFPERKIPRDRYLLIHIISSRESFLTFARRQIKSKVKGDAGIFKVGFFDRLSHKYACCRRLVWLFSGSKKQCFLCGVKGDLEDLESFIHCPNCDTVYCIYCYADLEGLCTACLKPTDYGDLSDISEENGSESGDNPTNPSDSEDYSTQYYKIRSKRNKRKRTSSGKDGYQQLLGESRSNFDSDSSQYEDPESSRGENNGDEGGMEETQNNDTTESYSSFAPLSESEGGESTQYRRNTGKSDSSKVYDEIEDGDTSTFN